MKPDKKQAGKGYIYDAQAVLFGHREPIGFGEHSFRVERIARELANRLIQQNHYSRKFYSASYIHLGVFSGADLLGVLQFGYAMNPASASSVVRETADNQYLELNRMWLDDSLGRNSESRAISYAIKYIKKRYPDVQWIQSFADERCGRFGVVYQAANFEYFGEHSSVFWELDGVVYHNSLMTRAPELSKAAAFLQANKDRAIARTYRQFRYLYFIDKRARRRCTLRKLDYPKHGKEAAA